MRFLPIKSFLTIVTFLFLSSCGNVSDEVENKLNALIDKTETLDSIINKEVDKVLVLDYLIHDENEKVKKLDSLIQKSASKLDSISNESINRYERLLNN